MNKFDSLEVPDYLDENMKSLSEVIARAGFLSCEYSCGGHLDNKKTDKNGNVTYQVANATTIYISIETNPDDTRSHSFFKGLQDRLQDCELRGDKNNISISYPLIARGIPKETTNFFNQDPGYYRISEVLAKKTERKAKKFIKTFTGYINDFLSEQEKSKPVIHHTKKMTGFLLKYGHEI